MNEEWIDKTESAEYSKDDEINELKQENALLKFLVGLKNDRDTSVPTFSKGPSPVENAGGNPVPASGSGTVEVTGIASLFDIALDELESAGVKPTLAQRDAVNACVEMEKENVRLVDEIDDWKRWHEDALDDYKFVSERVEDLKVENVRLVDENVNLVAENRKLKDENERIKKEKITFKFCPRSG